MKTSASTTVIERLIDLELIFKLKSDLAKYKRNNEFRDKKDVRPKAA